MSTFKLFGNNKTNIKYTCAFANFCEISYLLLREKEYSINNNFITEFCATTISESKFRDKNRDLLTTVNRL